MLLAKTQLTLFCITTYIYISPWKETQIAYLKTLQTGDLRRRRERYPQTNEMFLAYEVIPATETAARQQPLILDLNNVYNLPSYAANEDWVRGEILGFCEITQRPYGLGQLDEYDDELMMMSFDGEF